MADLQLIQGEKFARTGGLKAGQLDNVGEQIGTGLEAIGKEVQEAMVKVSSWGDAEEAFNNDMQKVETDGFLSGNDAGFSEQDAASGYMTGLKKTYGDAAAKASRIENKSSDAYKNQVKIMNDVNAAAKNFAGQKDALIASRKSYQENPAGLSVSNSFDTSSASQMNFLSGKGEWNVDEKGNIIVDGKKMSDMGKLKEKSELNSLATQVYSDTYESSLKTGSALTDNQIEKAGENVINSLVSGGNPKDNVASFAFDPLTGTQTLYSKDSEEGKALAENIRNWDSLTDVQKNQIYSEIAEKHKTLLKDQNKKGIEDYKKNNPSADTVEETYYSTDDQFDLLASSAAGDKIVKIGSDLYMTDGKKIGRAIPDPVDSKKYTLDPYQSVSLKNSDGNFNYKEFSALTGGSTKTRTVEKKARITAETSEGTTTGTSTTTGTTTGTSAGTDTDADAGAGDASTTTEGGEKVEVNIGGNTVTTTTGTELPDEARGFSPPPPSGETTGSSTGAETETEAEVETEAESIDGELEEAQKAEDELSDIELEEEISKEKFSMPLTDFRSGVRKGEITMQDVDTKIKILNAQYKKDSISEAKYKKDIKFINEKIMPLLPDDIPGGKKIDEAMIANQLEQDKKDLDARQLNPADFPPEQGPVINLEEVVITATPSDSAKTFGPKGKYSTLLGIVSKNEAGKGEGAYDAIFGSPNGPKKMPDGGPPMSKRTIGEVLKFQQDLVDDGNFNEGRIWEALSGQRSFDSTTGTKEFWDKKIKAKGLTQEQIMDRDFMLGSKGAIRNMKPFSSASGKYQFMQSTIEGLVAQGVISEEDTFNIETQNKMAVALIGEKRIQKFLDGKISTKAFAKSLAVTWSSLPKDESGESAYKGISGNKALEKWEDFAKSLEDYKKQNTASKEKTVKEKEEKATKQKEKAAKQKEIAKKEKAKKAFLDSKGL
jgi:hypothetical protein